MIFTPAAYTTLSGILARQPDFATVQGRVDFLTGAYAGQNGGDAVLNGLSFEGAPRAVAVRVLTQLEMVGTFAPGQPAALPLIDALLRAIGVGGDAEELTDIRAQLLAAAAPPPPPPPPRLNRVELRKLLSERFTKNDLETLCADIQGTLRADGRDVRLDLDTLGGESVPMIALNLIRWAENRGHYEVLVAAARNMRPAASAA